MAASVDALKAQLADVAREKMRAHERIAAARTEEVNKVCVRLEAKATDAEASVRARLETLEQQVGQLPGTAPTATRLQAKPTSPPLPARGRLFDAYE